MSYRQSLGGSRRHYVGSSEEVTQRNSAIDRRVKIDFQQGRHSTKGMEAILVTQNEQKDKTDDSSLENFISASLGFHGLHLTAEDRDAILESAKSIADAHKLVRSFPLPEEMDAAPVFSA
jgi:hypothetical protein